MIFYKIHPGFNPRDSHVQSDSVNVEPEVNNSIIIVNEVIEVKPGTSKVQEKTVLTNNAFDDQAKTCGLVDIDISC